MPKLGAKSLEMFEFLPQEIIEKIFCVLLDDPKSFINLATTNKRLNYISQRVTIKQQWVDRRPLTFDFYQELDLYKPEICSQHGLCVEQQYRTSTRCELRFKNSSCINCSSNNHVSNPLLSSPSVNEDGFEQKEEICYYHRLYAMLNAKYITFSTLKFKQAHLSDRGCIRSFRDTWRADRVLAERKVRSLVDLQLYDCDISLDWLNTVLNELDNIRYLTLHGVAFADASLLVEPRDLASKSLNLLKITGDTTYNINDSIFMYFFENFSAKVLDLSGTRIEFHKRIIQRYYPNLNTIESYTSRPSEFILTFPIVLMYLKKFQAVIKQFIASQTSINLASLRRLLIDDDLQHLAVVIQNCPMINIAERSRLEELVDENAINRVVF